MNLFVSTVICGAGDAATAAAAALASRSPSGGIRIAAPIGGTPSLASPRAARAAVSAARVRGGKFGGVGQGIGPQLFGLLGVRPWPASACSRSIRTSGPAKGPRPSGYFYSSDSPRGEMRRKGDAGPGAGVAGGAEPPEQRAGGEASVPDRAGRNRVSWDGVPSALAKRLAARDASGGEQNAHAQTARLDGFHGVVGAGRFETADAHEEGSMQRLVHADEKNGDGFREFHQGIGKSCPGIRAATLTSILSA